VRLRAKSAIDVIAARAEDKAFKAFVQWSVAKDFNANEPHEPLVVQDKVIVGTDQGQLRAYRCADGESIWVHQHGARIFHRPCSDGQRIYFTSAKGLTAVNAKDGTEMWRLDRACCDGPTFVHAKQETVFVAGNDGNLYALDAKTGKQVWASDFLADAPPDPPNFPGERARMANTKARPSALASDGETLFLSVFDQCRIVAFNAADGKRLWSFQTGGWVFGEAVVTEKHVFFGSQDESYYCVDKQTGRKVWSHETKGRIESGGAVDDRFVYFGSCDGGVYCLNQSDGKLRWRFATDQQEGHNSAIYSVPVLRQGGVYFAAGEGQAYAVNQHTGELKWKVRPSKGSQLYCSPASDPTLFFLVTRADGKGSARRRSWRSASNDGATPAGASGMSLFWWETLGSGLFADFVTESAT
jgi:outer membrane protein assembly factor BamB